ncbi:hypothetical protein PYCC9005_002244 [Savitreella phatthalungensis]
MESINPHRPYYVPRPNPSVSFGNPTSTSGALSGASPIIDESAITSEGFSLEVVTALVQQYATEYFGVAVAQPFENAKLLLQVAEAPRLSGDLESQTTTAAGKTTADENHQADEDEDDDEDPDYFSEKQVQTEIRTTDRSGYVVSNPRDSATIPSWHFIPTSITQTISEIYNRDGLSGPFRATPAAFFHHILREAIESWLSGALSALGGLPDPTIALDPYDGVSLGIAVLSTCTTALLLSPIDCYRVRSVLLPRRQKPLPLLNGYRIPQSLILPTVIERASSVGLSYLLSSVWEPISSLAQLVVKLPLETALRRAQAQYVTRGGREDKSIVRLGPYTGLATPWSITSQERDGVAGLYRGWKAGAWGVVGVWTLGLLAAQRQADLSEF